MRIPMTKILVLILLGVLVQGCETLKDMGFGKSEEENNQNWTAKKFHEKARQAMAAKNYQKAIELYENLESRFPFGDYAAQTQLDLAYAYYKNDKPDAAIAAAERFIKVHPTNPHVDYAYYLKGLVNYNRSIGFLERYLPTDSSQRDPGNARDAYENFAELLRRYPDSQYAADARQRMIALRNNLAMYEVHVARFYLKRNAFVAAVNRASTVVKDYQQTIAVPYALRILKTAYTKLNLTELADDAGRVYKLNYPDGPPQSDVNKTFFEELWDVTALDE